MSKFIKKFAAGQKHSANVGFRPANDIELQALKKELGDNIPDGYIAGWASTPDMDVYNHIVMNGAFEKSIAKRGLSGPKGIKLLLGHNWDQMAGIIKKLEYRPGGLWIEAQMNLSVSYVKDAYETAKQNDGISFSVGFILLAYAVKGNDKDGEWLQIDEGDLYEVSIVPFPANDAAGMLFIKDRNGRMIELSTVAEFEKHLVASGLVKNRNDARTITQVVKKSSSLFLKAPADPVLAEPTDKPPLLAVDKLKSLQAKMAEMKAILAP